MMSKTWRRGWSALLAAALFLSIIAQPLSAAASSELLFPSGSLDSSQQVQSSGATLVPSSGGGQTSQTPNSGYSTGDVSSTQAASSTLVPSGGNADSGSSTPSAASTNDGTGSLLIPTTGSASSDAAAANGANGGSNAVDDGSTGSTNSDGSDSASGNAASDGTEAGSDGNSATEGEANQPDGDNEMLTAGDANANDDNAAGDSAAKGEQVFDEEGNPVLDDEGNPVYLPAAGETAQGHTDSPSTHMPVVYGEATAAMSRSALARGGSGSVTPMASGFPEVSLDLRDWIVYDHYWNSTAQGHLYPGMTTRYAYQYSVYLTAAQKNSYGITYSYQGLEDLHPYYFNYDTYNRSTVYDLGTASGIASYETNVLSKNDPELQRVTQHIYQQGSSESTEFTFSGYGSTGRMDWVLAPIKQEYLTELKSVQFDINAGYVRPHTLHSFGILFNTGFDSTGKYMTGYALVIYPKVSTGNSYDPMTSGTMEIRKFTNLDANQLHLGTATTLNSSGGVTAINNDNVWTLVNKSTLVTKLYYSPTQSGSATANSEFSLDLSKTVDKTFRVNIEAETNQVQIKVGYFDSNGDVYQSYYLTTQNAPWSSAIAIADTGYPMFGPYMSYAGQGHNCYRLSWAKFMRLRATVGSNIFYNYNNPDDPSTYMTQYETFDRVYGLPKGTSLADNSLSLPKTLPQRQGYVFTGWNTLRTGQGDKFDENYKVNVGILELYAQWSKLGIDVSYMPSSYTNQNVTASFSIASAAQPDRVYIKYADGTEENVTVTAGSAGTYVGTKVYQKNFTGAKIYAVVKDGTYDISGNLNTMTVEAPVAVTWIDKLAPLVTVPANNSQLTSTSVTINDAAATTDYAMSGIDSVKTKVTLTGASGTYTGSTWAAVWSQVSSKTDVYTLTVEAWDVAGNSTIKTATGVYTIDPNNKTITTKVTYSPTTWVKQDGVNKVTATITITAAVRPTVTVNGQAATVNGSASPYTVTVDFLQNAANIPVVISTSIPGYGATASLTVNWFDKYAPTVRNLPDVSSKGGVLVASDLGSVAFADVRDNDTISFNSNGYSGVNTSTRTLLLYKVTNGTVASTPSYTIPWSSLSALLPNVDAGLYYYDVTVADNVGHVGKASDFYNGLIGQKPDPDKPGPDPGDPTDPTVPPVIINAKDPTITLTPDRAANAKGWYNADVTMTVTATGGGVGFNTVNVANTLGENHAYNSGNVSGFNYNGTFKLTKDGTHGLTGNVINAAGLTGNATSTIKIDKTAPTITITDKGSNNYLSDINIAFNDATSGIDNDTIKVVITSTDGKTSVTLEGSKITDLATEIAKLPSGEYKVQTSVKDNAGNSATNNPSTTFTHENVDDNYGVKIEITYAPPRENGWTQPDVVATIKITSKTPMTAAVIDGATTTLTGANQTSYTTTRTFSTNRSFNVDVTLASGKTPTGATAKVDWIDRINPEVKNLPDLTSKNGKLTAGELSGVSFADIKDAAATYQATGYSGIKDSTKTLLLYKVTNGTVASTPTYTIPWSNLTSGLAAVAGGQYYYDITVEDNVGNKGKASDFYNGLIGQKPDPDKPGPDPGDPEDPTDPPVIINADDPTIKLTPDRAANSHGWYNADVTMTVTATGGGVGFNTVNVVDTLAEGHTYSSANATNFNYSAAFKLTKEGTHGLTGTAINIAAMTATTTASIKIDKTAPTITITDKGGNNYLSDINIVFDDALSGVDNDTIKVVITDKSGNPVLTLEGSKVTDLATEIAKLPSGEYKVQTSVKDKAGNSATNNPSTTFTHENVDDNYGVKIEITYAPPRENGWTQPDVVATIKVTSKTPMTAVVIDGTSTTMNTATQYSYTTTRTFSTNRNFNVDVTLASGKTPTGATAKVDWIDRINPEVKNLPDLSSKNGKLTAGELSGVSFADIKDAAATYQATGYSGIKDSTKTLLLYKVTNGTVAATPTYTIPWSNLTSGLAAVAGGQYYYDITVEDNVGNKGKASDFYNGLIGQEPDPDKPGPDPGDPEDPTDPPVIINADDPTIKLTPDRAANSHGWYNADVEMTVTATGGGVGFNTVNVVDTLAEGHTYNSANVTNFNYAAKFKLTKEGTHGLTGTATNIAVLTATTTASIKIDKTAPTITITDKGGNNYLSDINIVFDDALSGVDDDTIKVVITDTGGTPVLTLEGSKVTDLAAEIAKLPSGEYKVQTSVKDKAGNAATNNPNTTFIHEKKEDNYGVTIKVEYTPDKTWHQPTVKAKITVTSKTNMSSVTIDGTTETVTGKSYVKEYVFNANKSIDVKAVLATGNSYEEKATVNWLDLLNPVISNLPDVSTAGSVLTASDLGAVKFDDQKDNATVAFDPKGYSDIDDSSKELWLYKVSGGTVSTTAVKIKWAELSAKIPNVAPGRYYYDVVVLDNVGNQGKASDTYNGLIGDKPDPNKPGPDPGDPSDPDVPGVIINAKNPLLTIAPDRAPEYTSPAGEKWYKNGVGVMVDGDGNSLAIEKLELNDTNPVNGVYVDNSQMGNIIYSFAYEESGEGKHVVSGTITNEADLTGNDSNTFYIDATAPTVTVEDKNGGELDSIVITGKDDQSGIDDDSYKVIVTGDDGKKYEFTGDPDDFGKWCDDELPSGEYTIVVTVDDNVGHSSDPKTSGPYWHEDPTETLDELIKISYGLNPQPTNYTDPVTGKKYTSGNVEVVNVTVKSKLRAQTITVGGVAMSVSSTIKVGSDGYYTYTFAKAMEVTVNGQMDIVVTTKGKMSPKADGDDIQMIDKLAPAITVTGATYVSDLLKSGVVEIDDKANTLYVASGYASSKTVYTMKSASMSTAASGTDLQTVINTVKAQASSGDYVTLSITAYDNVGNANKYDHGQNLKLDSGVTNNGKVTVSFNGNESALAGTAVNANLQFLIKETSPVTLTITNAGGTEVYKGLTNVSSSTSTVQVTANAVTGRIITKFLVAGTYTLTFSCAGYDNTVFTAVIKSGGRY